MPQNEWSKIVRRRRSEIPKTRYKLVDALDLTDGNIGKCIAKLDVGEPVRQKFGERADRDEWILDLVSDARGKRTEGGETFGTALFGLESLQACEIGENNDGTERRGIGVGERGC